MCGYLCHWVDINLLTDVPNIILKLLLEQLKFSLNFNVNFILSVALCLLSCVQTKLTRI